MNSFLSSDNRLNLRVSVDLILNKYVKGRPYLCRVSNMSRHGVLIHQMAEPDSHEKWIGLQFQLPTSSRIITCAGKIMFQDSLRKIQGIKLTNIAQEHQQIIDHYLLTQPRLA